MPHETYLGDGLYASFDGWHIILRAPKEEGDHIVALDGTVLNDFIRFAAQTAGRERLIKILEGPI